MDDWNILTGSKHIVINVHRFRKPPFEHVSVGEKVVSIRVTRIDRERGGEVAFRFGKMVATPIDVARENKERAAVRQTRAGDGKFFKCAMIIAQTTEEIIGAGKMRLGGIRSQPEPRVHRIRGK